MIIMILSFDIAPYPYKHAQRRITFHCQRIDLHKIIIETNKGGVFTLKMFNKEITLFEVHLRYLVPISAARGQQGQLRNSYTRFVGRR